MDVLSDVIAVLRTGRPRSAHVRWHAPWAQEFAPVPGSAAFQVVLRGSCWLLPSGREPVQGGAGRGPFVGGPEQVAAVDVPSADGPVQLGPGDVLFLPRGSGHRLADSPTAPVTAPACGPDDPRWAAPYASDSVDPTGGSGPVTVVLCGTYALDPSRTHPLLGGLPERIHLPARSQLRGLVDLLAAEVEKPRLGTDAAVPALLDTLLLYILRDWCEGQPARGDTTGWAAALNDPAVTAALHAVHRDPAAPWTVAALAAEAGLSRAPFARRFAALVGRPPLTYLTWWRMTTAARLLRTSDAPLKSIAGQVGYASEFAFAHAFKRLYGTAPGAYRRQAPVR